MNVEVAVVVVAAGFSVFTLGILVGTLLLRRGRHAPD